MVVAAVASLILNFVSHEAESLAQRECDVITARPIESQKKPRAFASVHKRSQETHEIRKRSPLSNAIRWLISEGKALTFSENVNTSCLSKKYYGRKSAPSQFLLRGLCLIGNVDFLFHRHLQLLVFSATPFKEDQNKKSKPFNRLGPESGKRKKVDMQRLSSRLGPQQFFLWKICGETYSPNL